MVKKVYYLKTCNSSMRFLKSLGGLLDDFVFFEIKSQPITLEQLNEMRKLAGSYEALFSRRAKKYKEMGLKNFDLTEEDYKNYILNEYTFLKRPVIIVGTDIFIGSKPKNFEVLKLKLQKQ